MKRLSMMFLPIIAVGAMLMGGINLYAGAKTLIAGDRGTGLFLLAFGMCGIALGLALWNVWRKFTRPIPKAD
jgi:hypothetical protein